MVIVGNERISAGVFPHQGKALSFSIPDSGLRGHALEDLHPIGGKAQPGQSNSAAVGPKLGNNKPYVLDIESLSGKNDKGVYWQDSRDSKI
jgi:hypothetical protein